MSNRVAIVCCAMSALAIPIAACATQPPPPPKVEMVTVAPDPSATSRDENDDGGDRETIDEATVANGPQECGEGTHATVNGCSLDTAPAAPASFDEATARRTLRAIDLSACAKPKAPTGFGHAAVTFAEDGSVISVEVAAPFASTAVGTCVAEKYRAVRVAAFSGEGPRVNKLFKIGKISKVDAAALEADDNL